MIVHKLSVYLHPLITPLCLLFSSALWADNSISVVYPEVRKPYRLNFDEIIKGINDSLGQDTTTFALKNNNAIKPIESWIEATSNPLIIALGRQAMSLTKTIKPDIYLILSSVITAPSNVPSNGIVVNYTPAPFRMFETLKTFAPEITTINAVFNPDINSWLVSYVEAAASHHNLNIKIVFAKTLKESGRLYQKIVSEIDPRHEAIWLPQDSVTINNQTIIPFLLEKAWKRKLILFSSTLSHADKGVLFSMYPNNKAVGKQLGVLAKEVVSGIYKGPHFLLLDELKLAVNIRTARHLGLPLGREKKKKVDVLFPK